MDNVILVAVFERGPDLTSKLPSGAFAETTVRDNVIEHLSPVDVFEYHVVVARMGDDFTHPADIRMIEKHAERSLADMSNFLARVLSLGLGQLGSRQRCSRVIRGDARDDFHRELCYRLANVGSSSVLLTFSPVGVCTASLTFPILPAPSVFVST